MGSLGLAWWVARILFLALLLIGYTSGEVRGRALALFIVLGGVAWIGLPWLQAETLATSALALLDIALVFVVFQGDVRIT